MCGIAGIFSFNPADVAASLHQLQGSLQHRGPDGSGSWKSADGRLGLSHNRLTILDLTDCGQQPLQFMHYTIVFNGAIYNYRELKQQLQSQGYRFETATDTEVIPAAYHYWGMEFLHKLDGMFAFALFDAKNDELIIARDRFGEKPLYYCADYGSGRKINRLIFASEMKALWAAGVPKQLNNTFILNYLTLGYVQNPVKKSQTFYSNILSVSPGYYLKLSTTAASLQKKRWYSYQPAEFVLNDKEATDQLTTIMDESVALRLRSDVTLATSLSGGLDSAAILATIKKMASDNSWSNRCFSAVFPGFEKDESAYSEQLANAFGVRRITVAPQASHLWQQLERMLYFQEEPVSSASVFAQYLLYRSAKENGVKVILDGQGADEILAGYKRYSHWYLQQLIRAKHWKQFVAEKQQLQAHSFLEQWGWKNYAAAFFPEKAAHQLQQQARAQQQQHPYIHPDLLSHQNVSTLYKPVVRNVNDMLYYNVFYHGLEELLRFADRNAMAHGVEVRLPYLSHKMVAFSLSLPGHFKIRNGYTKWILRKCFDRQLPTNVVWRKDKIGYEPPQASWMKEKNLHEMVQDARRKLVNHHILNKAIIDAPALSSSAHHANNLDWRILNMAYFI